MNRRQFLYYSAAWGASLALGNIVSSCSQASIKSPIDKALLEEVRIIDAHAHPDQFYDDNPPRIDKTSSLKTIKAVGMVASSFSAVGDYVFLSRGRLRGSEFNCTIKQLKYFRRHVESGKVKLILKASDVPEILESRNYTGAILAIEGGDALDGNPNKVNEFHSIGVRMITLVHYRNNEFGDIMRRIENLDPGPMHNGLTQVGRKVVERMQEIGMVVDVAHADSATLKQIAEMSVRPLVDSHTSVCPLGNSSECGPLRLRNWKEMELVAKTGGAICTWPLAFRAGIFKRKTFLDWAKEILEMKKRLGMEHVGLGTDGGGMLPALIDGYYDVRDLVLLVAAMQEVGLSQDDIKLYLGGSFYRVLRNCIG